MKFTIFCTIFITAATLLAEPRETRITPIVQAIAKVMPSVVNLSTVKSAEFNNGNHNDQYHEQEIETDTGKSFSLGSGSIIDSSGLIVTSAHVVRQSIKINATLHDGRNFNAELLAADELNDLALLRINSKEPLTPIPLAAPGDLLLGETVIVAGNPYGLGNTITQGVLSAIGRKVANQDQLIFTDLLQTDAAVYPGSSGGPLININGDMIGLNSAMLKAEKSINFAIPLQRIENTLAGWLIPERFDNVSLGIIPAVQRHEDGRLAIYVREIFHDSPAARVGIKPGMRIREFNAKTVSDLMEFSRLIHKIPANEKCVLITDDNATFKFKTEKLAFADGKKLAEMKLGLKLQPLTTEIASALNYPFAGGAVVSAMPENVSATGIERGDVLLRLGDVAINNINDIGKALQDKAFGTIVPALLVTVKQYENRY